LGPLVLLHVKEPMVQKKHLITLPPETGSD